MRIRAKRVATELCARITARDREHGHPFGKFAYGLLAIASASTALHGVSLHSVIQASDSAFLFVMLVLILGLTYHPCLRFTLVAGGAQCCTFPLWHVTVASLLQAAQASNVLCVITESESSYFIALSNGDAETDVELAIHLSRTDNGKLHTGWAKISRSGDRTNAMPAVQYRAVQ